MKHRFSCFKSPPSLSLQKENMFLLGGRRENWCPRPGGQLVETSDWWLWSQKEEDIDFDSSYSSCLSQTVSSQFSSKPQVTMKAGKGRKQMLDADFGVPSIGNAGLNGENTCQVVQQCFGRIWGKENSCVGISLTLWGNFHFAEFNLLPLATVVISHLPSCIFSWPALWNIIGITKWHYWQILSCHEQSMESANKRTQSSTFI